MNTEPKMELIARYGLNTMLAYRLKSGHYRARIFGLFDDKGEVVRNEDGKIITADNLDALVQRVKQINPKGFRWEWEI